MKMRIARRFISQEVFKTFTQEVISDIINDMKNELSCSETDNVEASVLLVPDTDDVYLRVVKYVEEES